MDMVSQQDYLASTPILPVAVLPSIIVHAALEATKIESGFGFSGTFCLSENNQPE